ncbi:MAG TPA: hypothetical protein VHB02_07925 [Acidimicrobiales bacterium]|nr:hypothetical protein [Acidimicrobiales bacterium]
MADGVFEVQVVTPEQQLLDLPAKALVLRSSDGDLTVLDGHTALITDVVPGDVRVDPDEGDPVHLAVHGGYLHVETGIHLGGAGPAVGGPSARGVAADGSPGRGDAAPSATAGERRTRATLLAGVAELADQIDVPRAQEARARAEARVEELKAAAGRSSGGAAGSGAGASAGSSADGEGPSQEDLELAGAEAALRRAEVRLEVAGATS